MALYGDLTTIPVTDLLQWVENARKSGVLTIRAHDVTRGVVFRRGRIAACSSNDPSTLLGQALLARGIIDKEALREALAHQERHGGTLGAILVERGCATSQQVVEAVHAKAEETIYALFDDDNAGFRFDENGEPPPNLVQTDLRIQDVLLKGLQRYDEMKRIREVFPHRGVVLARTDRPVPAAVQSGRVAARILQALDGRRSIAEVLLHARVSAYLVSKFLFELYRNDLVKIVEIRSPAGPAAEEAPVVVSTSGASDARPDGGPAEELAVAQGLLARNEPDAALAVLNATARAHPGAPLVREMISRAESVWAESLHARIPADAVPVQVASVSGLDGDTVEPGEAYLLTLVDGRTDVRTLVWTVPMREVDVLRALDGLIDKGCIRLGLPD